MPTATQAKTAEPTVDAEGVERQFLDGVKQANQSTIDAISTWAQTVATFAPNATLLPSAKDLAAAADAWFTFNAQLLEVQRDFAAKFVSAVAPVTAKS